MLWTFAYATPARRARTSSANSPAAMPCAAGPMTSAGRNVPVTLPLAGQAWVPAGPLPRLVHRNTETPPFTDSCPKWMWACCGGADQAP